MTVRRTLPFVALVGITCALVAGVHSQEPQTPASLPQAQIEGGDLWFVELTGAPTGDGGSLAGVRQEKAAFRAAAQQAGLRYTERRAFDTLWNGLSIRVDRAQLSTLARLRGVKAIYPVEAVLPPPVGQEPGPALATALAMTGADFVQSELGFTGEGVRVAVMDSGIDYHHPDLGGCFGPGCRVATGWDFVGEFFTGLNDPTPDADPDDCKTPDAPVPPGLTFAGGHGTHVTGIVGASAAEPGGVTGVAPGVTFGAYRVFGCAGFTHADIMIAAMERALADGMHVLNMSIGASFQWPQYPTAQAADRLVNRGMVVVAAIANAGANGVYSAAAPGVGQKVIGVASFDNTHVVLPMFTISPDAAPIGYTTAAAAPEAPTSGSFPMARTGTTSSTDDACDPLAGGSLAGHVALIRRGTCTFHQKALNAQNAGAAAVVLYNNAPGRFSATVAGTPAITIPVVAISDLEGALIDGRLASGPVTMTWTGQQQSFVNPTGNLISSFSAYGVSPDLVLKPDIGAPGGLIRSTYPLELGVYATSSGTSMSSPHVAGAAALLLEARPRTPAQAVGGILQNTADPKVWWGNPGLGFLDNVHRQGAGMVQIDKAILSTTNVTPAKLSLGESQAGPATRTLRIENNGAEVTYALSHVPALSTGPSMSDPTGTFVPGFFTGFASVAFSESSVNVPAGGTATVDVTIAANPALPDRSQYGGYIVLTPQGGGQVYQVPYAGFKGDYQSILVLNPGASTFGNPILRPSLSFGPSGPVTFNPDADEVAWILVHLDHQVRKLRLEVFEAGTGKAWHRALDLEYVGRNSTAGGFFGLSWDGVTTNGSQVNVLPDGDYVLVLSVQKALGDDDDPAHRETWTSPVITIQRP